MLEVTWTRRIFLKERLAGWIALVIGATAYALIRQRLPDASESFGKT
jgi:hypothetical protein